MTTGSTLRVLPGTLAVVRLGPDEPLPGWAAPDVGEPGELHAVIRTRAELAVVCAERRVPDGVLAERGWRTLAVAGPLDLALTGVLAALAVPLAEAGVPIFVVSTYDTDHVLVRADRLGDAVGALHAAGHRVTADQPDRTPIVSRPTYPRPRARSAGSDFDPPAV